MKSLGTLISAMGMIVLLSGELLAGPRIAASPAQSRGARFGGGPRADIQRYWRPAVPRRPYYQRNFYYYPKYYHYHDPRSVIIITPSPYYPYHAFGTILTSQPYYCHLHHVGFVSRVGFLDHISGTHKIPLETADAICTEANESCVIEGY